MTFDPTTQICRRKSLVQYHIVDLACCIGNPREAAELLARHHIPVEVARRVLLHPEQRRRLS